MGMILRIASSRIVGQGDIVGRSGYFSLNLSANSVMRGRLDARRTLKSLVADLRYFRIINTLLFSKDENELRTSMESLKKETRLDEYFTFGYGAHHLWICQRKPSDKNKIFPHRIMMIQF